MRNDKPWRVDAYTAREKNELLCYSGGVQGPVVWQKGTLVSHGEFSRMDWNVPIHEASIYLTHSHECRSEAEARERAAEHAGFRKSFGVAPDGWRIANAHISDALENYRGYDSFFLSMRETVRFYGRLSDNQLRAYRRMAWKLNP